MMEYRRIHRMPKAKKTTGGFILNNIRILYEDNHLPGGGTAEYAGTGYHGE